MRLVGASDKIETYDTRSSTEVFGKRIFEFDVNKEDYMLRYFSTWEETIGEFIIDVGGYRYMIPSGVYIYCGCESGSTDWVMIDEMINRDISVFQMDTDFGSWDLSEIKLHSMTKQTIYLPSTKNPLPIADVSGTRTIVMAYHDMYHKLKDKDYGILFVS